MRWPCGAGCEQLFKAVIQEELGLTPKQVFWDFEVVKKDDSKARVELDVLIALKHLRDDAKKSAVKDWLRRGGQALELPDERVPRLCGAVFEVRQGYESADAKRTNADLRFGRHAVVQDYLPVLAVVSTQASASVLRRYRNQKMLVLTGTRSDNDTGSTFAFFKNVIGYELDKFFERNKDAMRERCHQVLESLLGVPKPQPPAPTNAVTPMKRRKR